MVKNKKKPDSKKVDKEKQSQKKHSPSITDIEKKEIEDNNNKRLKEDFQKVKNEHNLTDDEIVEINRLLDKIDNSERKIILSRKDINKKTIYHVVRKIFFSYLLYAVVYFAMFGLLSKWISFNPRHLIGYITLGYAAYMVLFRYVCRLITEKTQHYLSIYNVFSLITVLVIFESSKLIPGYNINGFFIIIIFYYVSEIIITALRHYLFKYLPSKLMWRDRKW